MPKENRKYFSHDYDARNDRQTALLLVHYKSAGYGIFWATVEMMHQYQERGEHLPFDDFTLTAIAKDLSEDVSLVKKVLTDCVKKYDLFKIKNKCFTSNRVDSNIEYYQKSIQQRSEAGMASAEAKKRRKSGENLTENDVNEPSTAVQRTVNGRSTRFNEPSTAVQRDSTNPQRDSTNPQRDSTNPQRTLNEIQQSKKQSKSNIAIKDSNSVSYPTKIESNAEQDVVKKIATLAFKNFDENLPDDFIDAEVGKILDDRKTNSKIKTISNIDSFVYGRMKKIKERYGEIPITIKTPDGKKHKPRINGTSIEYRTIKFVSVDKQKKEVVLADGSRIKLKGGDLTALEKGILIEDKFFKGMKY